MQQFIGALEKHIAKERIITDPIRCFAYGTDASIYRLTPKIVIKVINQDEIIHLMKLATQFNLPLTFRTAGTSLSGQAVTDQILVILENNSWQNFKIFNNGAQISLEPGIIGARANALLKPYNYKIGPDPSSINACKIGGIVANNASGMCCGTKHNSYQTLAGMQLILANGSKLDTSDDVSRAEFSCNNPAIIKGIENLKQQIISDCEISDLINHKFKIKNTSGYSLNAFLDYDDPIDILAHLMVGSEGTLGFISEVTYECVPVKPFKAVSLIYCKNLNSIVQLVIKLNNFAVDAIELLDNSSLIAIEKLEHARKYLPKIIESDTSAILVEISAGTESELLNLIEQIKPIIYQEPIYHQIEFTSNEEISHDLWALRKGILPLIGGIRPKGTTVVIEDIAVPINSLPYLIEDLNDLFKKYNYSNTAIFGHVLSGNIHFIFTPRFDSKIEVERYNNLMQYMANLVAIKFKGSLKAEHGCGRNIAPFVKLEWGDKIYQIMWQIKHLLDPHGILNPDVILSSNQEIHMQNLKEMTQVDDLIDKCIECGFCEKLCPSKNLSLTPRARIATSRYLNRLKNTDKKAYKAGLKRFNYLGVKTCATTGLCAYECPVGIDTGKYILSLKNSKNSFLANFLGKHFNLVVYFSRTILNIAKFSDKVLGKGRLPKFTQFTKRIIPMIPIYNDQVSGAQKAKFINNHIQSNQSTIIYLPSCGTRMMGDCLSTDNKQNAMQTLIQKLGLNIIYPDNLANLCCGQAFGSMGNSCLSQTKLTELELAISKLGNYKIITDNSSCLFSIKTKSKLDIIDSIEFIFSNLDQIKLTPKYTKIALHYDCSSRKQNYFNKIHAIVKQCAHEIIFPEDIYCCGFAGTKGFFVPELNQTALSTLKNQVRDCEIGVTCNRNCQIGLSSNSGKTYISLTELVVNCLN